MSDKFNSERVLPILDISHNPPNVDYNGNSLYVFFGFVGLLFGMVYALSWSSAEEKDISKQIRVKNLIWLCFPVVALFFTNISSSFSEKIDSSIKIEALSCYMVCVFISFIGTSCYMIYMIKKVVVNVISDKRKAISISSRIEIFYLQYGYDGIKKPLQDIEYEERKRVYEIIGKYGETIYQLRQAINYNSDPQYNENIKMLLISAISIVNLFSSESSGVIVRANYMVIEGVSSVPREKIWFLDEGRELDSYGGVLVLRTYEDKTSYDIVLPYENPANFNQEKEVLPGAPSCVFYRKYTAMEFMDGELVSHINEGVKAEVIEKIKGYFKDKKFQSVLSIPLICSDDEIIGVLNIESNMSDIVDKGEEVLDDIASAMEPLCSTLADMIQSKRISTNP
ncbi:hypothetical protein LDL36_20410 [Komagataeibacter sp. FNDCR1]|nr:hypothetical protein [Komagataeibacter sp. FNDCR1]